MLKLQEFEQFVKRYKNCPVGAKAEPYCCYITSLSDVAYPSSQLTNQTRFVYYGLLNIEQSSVVKFLSIDNEICDLQYNLGFAPFTLFTNVRGSNIPAMFIGYRIEGAFTIDPTLFP